jgi:phosphate transport system permease protein
MSDAALSAPLVEGRRVAAETRLAARRRAERRFEIAGLAAIVLAGLALAALLGSLLVQGARAIREGSLAGVESALVGSGLTILVTLVLAAPIGVATAIYLEELAPRSRWIDVINVNIDNLAAVPSIVFGLAGLAVLITFFGLLRSTPLVGGVALGLVTLPRVIISTRAALKTAPPDVRAAALGVGASPVQVVFDHVLPLAAPGILSGVVIALSRALGEAAPLLMLGMVGVGAAAPAGSSSPAAAAPVQIYLWSTSGDQGLEARAAALILALLALMVVLNLIAVVLRRRLERRSV